MASELEVLVGFAQNYMAGRRAGFTETANDSRDAERLIERLANYKATPPADAALADELDDEARTLDIGGFTERAKLVREAAAALRARSDAEWERQYNVLCHRYDELIAGIVLCQYYGALRARAVTTVPLSALVCVGRARFPRTGGNAGIAWYVEDALSDTGGFCSGSPCNGELLFVLPTTAKRALLAASQPATGGA